MKKNLLILLVLIISVIIVSPCCGADQMKDYYFQDLQMHISLPENWNVICKDMDPDSDFLNGVGGYDFAMNYLDSNNIAIDALIPGSGYEFVLTTTKDNAELSALLFGDMDDFALSYLKKTFEEMEDYDIKVLEYNKFETSGMPFGEFVMERTGDKLITYVLYRTDYSFNFTFHTYGDAFPDDCQATLREIIKSIRLGETAETGQSQSYVQGSSTYEEPAGEFYETTPRSDFDIEEGTLRKYKGTDSRVYIPDDIIAIDSFAFSNADFLEYVQIPESVLLISQYAFSGCSNLRSVTIPESVIIIGDSAFSESGLEDLTIMDGVQYISGDAFYRCENLEYVQIPGSVVSIGDSAFWGCTNLKTVVIDEGVRILGSYAFQSCDALTHVTLPESLSYKGPGSIPYGTVIEYTSSASD
ncbi:MAG: leucine-rich repeat domain-containing protein [Anaerolineaceae bacterium]|nr:leucine-rich repeat domain-containing protein [Anaerolineaceae bacterium]